MKLVDKFTLWFIAVVILLMPISMFISFNNIKKNIDDAEIIHLRNIHDKLAARIKNGRPDTRPYGVKVENWAQNLPAQKVQVQESSAYNRELNRMERYFKLSTFYTIKNNNYRITSSSYVPRSDQILNGMLNAVVWKILLIILGVAITARLISRYILSSFVHTLQSIRDFNLRSAQKIKLKKTSIKEFTELNGFLEAMTDKAIEDFTAVKEFSENASHELQTPLAVIRSKLELLAETDIQHNQARLIGDMQNAVEKLSKINSSLVLLTRLENQEYQTKEKMDFCQVTRDVLAAYHDRMLLKSLQMEARIDEPVWLNLHPALADMILNNLLGNAIRHNRANGHIELELSPAGLIIRNTGAAPESPTHELFQRFKKGNQCTASVGLGLAIVKQICDLNGFLIRYDFDDGWHILTIRFSETSAQKSLSKTDKVLAEA